MKGTAYIIQGALISLWWLGLALSKDFFDAFQFPEISRAAFNSFLLPDVVVVAILSIVRAYKPSRDLELLILGGFAYGSLYCVNATILSHGGHLSTTIMLLGLAYNLFLVYQAKVFKTATSDSTFLNAIKTVVQILGVWSITLILFPWLVIDAFAIQMTNSFLIKVAALTLFSLSSLFGLRSAQVMVIKGKGTPLPADQTTKLVVTGPYRLVRNPMAVAGMGQGLSIALLFCSLHLVIYTLLGGLLWHFVVRPIEEKNMLNRFGSEYQKYRSRVKLWFPNTRKFKKK